MDGRAERYTAPGQASFACSIIRFVGAAGLPKSFGPMIVTNPSTTGETDPDVSDAVHAENSTIMIAAEKSFMKIALRLHHLLPE